MILRRLKTEEHARTRTLWHKVFDEDTSEFLDYYYTFKTDENEIYVIEAEGDIRSMLHLNPYWLRIGRKEAEARYIVAVGTDILYRKKGFMTELLRKSLRDMYAKNLPFAYLMPAAESIYYPHGFRFIYAAEQWKASVEGKEEVSIERLTCPANTEGRKAMPRTALPSDCKQIARFASKILNERYQVYAKRDWQYYERLLEEQKSQEGGILLAVRNGEIRGAVLYDEEAGFSVREPLVEKGDEAVFEEAGLVLTKKRKKKPMIMARLLHVESILECMVCHEEMEVMFVLVDPIIRENNKLFGIRGNSEHLVVRTRPNIRGKYEDIQRISVEALTSILFGYKSIAKIEEEEKEVFSEEFKSEIRKLIPLKGVFLNEIV
ncbi:GNAT family N-acetyltransferase [Roseburia hominis]